MKNVIDTELTTMSLTQMLTKLKADIAKDGQKITIKPTRLIIGEPQIQMFMRRWKLRRAKTLQRIRRWAGL